MSPNSIHSNKFWSAAGQFFGRVFILLGLPLLAWGLGSTAGFFSNPVRTSFAVVVIVQALVYAWLDYRAPPHSVGEHAHELASLHAIPFEMIFVVSAYSDSRNSATWNENMPLHWLGLGIYVIGAILATWATMTWVNHLRRAAGNACEDPVLLVEGPYRFIRYPPLLALIFYCLGVSILFRSWFGLALTIPLIAAIGYRSRTLDSIYADRYSRAWPLRSYRSKRFIPFVY